MIERLGIHVPLTPTPTRSLRRDLTDAEIHIALEQLACAARIYSGRKLDTSQVRNAESRLEQRLNAMRGRVVERDLDPEPAPCWTLVEPEPVYRISQALFDLYLESTGRPCASADDLIGWTKSNRGTAAILAACNRP